MDASSSKGPKLTRAILTPNDAPKKSKRKVSFDQSDSKSCASTQLPDENDALSGSADSMDTSCASKLSKSRSEKGRGPNRELKRLERSKKHKESLGLQWKEPEERKVENAEKMLPGFKGTAAVGMQDFFLRQKSKEEAPNWDDDSKRKVIEKDLVKEIPVDMCRWVQMVEGEPRCLLCQKQATEGHLVSSEHVRRIEEDAIGTLMGGKADTTRRFNGDLCKGVPTKKLIKDFWGDALENLPRVAMDIHRKKGVFYVNKKDFTPKDARYELGIVSYPGHGKYDKCSFLDYHDLPDCEEVATEEQKAVKIPEDQGWWPVIALKKEYANGVATRVLVVCWYQLLTDGRVIAWWIWLSRL